MKIFDVSEYEKFLEKRKSREELKTQSQENRVSDKSYLECLNEGASILNSRKELDDVFKR